MIWGLMIIFAPQQHDRRMTEMGHARHFKRAAATSVVHPTPDLSLRRAKRRFGPITTKVHCSKIKGEIRSET